METRLHKIESWSSKTECTLQNRKVSQQQQRMFLFFCFLSPIITITRDLSKIHEHDTAKTWSDHCYGYMQIRGRLSHCDE